MAVTIKNIKNQPYTLNVPGESAIYLQPKEQRILTEAQYEAQDTQDQQRAGNIIVLRVE